MGAVILLRQHLIYNRNLWELSKAILASISTERNERFACNYLLDGGAEGQTQLQPLTFTPNFQQKQNGLYAALPSSPRFHISFSHRWKVPFSLLGPFSTWPIYARHRSLATHHTCRVIGSSGAIWTDCHRMDPTTQILTVSKGQQSHSQKEKSVCSGYPSETVIKEL